MTGRCARLAAHTRTDPCCSGIVAAGLVAFAAVLARATRATAGSERQSRAGRVGSPGAGSCARTDPPVRGRARSRRSGCRPTPRARSRSSGRASARWCVDGLHFALVDDRRARARRRPRLRGAARRRAGVAGAGFAVPARARSACRARTPTSEVVFGSCRDHAARTSRPTSLRAHEHPDGQGIDALRAYALRAAGAGGGARLPDMLLMLGDQIYADEPSPALQEAITARRRPADTPDDELADFAEYALAYHEAWSEPAIRWLLSTVPTTMVFDDHEIHAEWRISQGWMDEMNAKPWFDRHIRAGLMAYWVFQHLGNLAPADLEGSSSTDAVRAADDGAAALAAADGQRRPPDRPQPLELRPSDRRRAARRDRLARGADVTPGRRELVQDEEWDWIAAQARQPARHLLAGQLGPVPARAGPALRRGVGRGGDRRSLGPADDADRRAPASSCRDGPLGVVPALDETDLRVG